MKPLTSHLSPLTSYLLPLTFYLLLLTSSAPALTDAWTVDVAQHTSVQRTYKQGETMDMYVSLRYRLAPLDLAGATARFYWYTNSTANVWWTNSVAIHSSSNGILHAVWSPGMDVGASSYAYWIGIWQAGATSPLWRVTGNIRMLPSPGILPNSLPIPIRILDFSTITVSNPPYVSAADWASGSNALASALQTVSTGLQEQVSLKVDKSSTNNWEVGSHSSFLTNVPPQSYTIITNPPWLPSRWKGITADLYVATDGSDAADGSAHRPRKTIQSAVISATAGQTILVADGVYDESGVVTSNKLVTIRSVNGAASSSIECWYSETSPQDDICFDARGGTNSTLIGFALRAGSLTNQKGGAAAYGGRLINCRIIECEAYGADAEGEGAIVSGSILINCLIESNNAYQGGICIFSTLYNCTVAGNSVRPDLSEEGGAICDSDAYNSIIFGNLPHDIFTSNQPYRIVTNCVWGTEFGDGTNVFPSVASDPLLPVDPPFIPSDASPCIDAGINARAFTTYGDLVGNARIIGPRVDIGAHENARVDYPLQSSGGITLSDVRTMTHTNQLWGAAGTNATYRLSWDITNRTFRVQEILP